MRTKIKDVKVIDGDKMLYTLYMYNNRIFELQIKSYNTGYCRHLKNKEAIVAFLVDIHTRKYLVFKEAVEKITCEEKTACDDFGVFKADRTPIVESHVINNGIS